MNKFTYYFEREREFNRFFQGCVKQSIEEKIGECGNIFEERENVFRIFFCFERTQERKGVSYTSVVWTDLQTYFWNSISCSNENEIRCLLEAQKRQWLASMPYKNDPSINPIAILYEILQEKYSFDWNALSRFHDERKRRENEQEQELDELKREVFNLPDDVEYGLCWFWLMKMREESLFLNSWIETTKDGKCYRTNSNESTDEIHTIMVGIIESHFGN